MQNGNIERRHEETRRSPTASKKSQQRVFDDVLACHGWPLTDPSHLPFVHVA
jgi:hypothetical protein